MGFVIAVAGVPGAGKSALARGLAAELDDAVTVHLDDYERFTPQTLDQVKAWAADGAYFDKLSMPGLVSELERSKAGPARYVVFETQFGRAHRANGRLIDLLVWVETPLDMALARKAREHIARGTDPAWLDGWLAGYLGFVRGLLVAQRDRVRPDADVILDGTLDPAELARRAAAEVRRRMGGV